MCNLFIQTRKAVMMHGYTSEELHKFEDAQTANGHRYLSLAELVDALDSERAFDELIEKAAQDFDKPQMAQQPAEEEPVAIATAKATLFQSPPVDKPNTAPDKAYTKPSRTCELDTNCLVM